MGQASLSAAFDHEVTEDKIVDGGFLEGLDGVSRAADDWLVVIEGRIEQQGNSRQRVEA